MGLKKTSGGAAAWDEVAVNVKLPRGQVTTFEVSPTTTIETICSLVADREGVSAERVNLKYTGKTLNKAHSVGYLGVREETVLKVELVAVKRITVQVKVSEEQVLSVDVENISSVMCIKDSVELQHSIPASKQTLKLRGRKLLKMKERCMDAGITDGCTLDLEVATKEATTAEEKVSTQDQAAADQKEFDKDAVLNTFEVDAGRSIDVAFSFDTTGSMYSCLSQVRDKLKETVTRLIEEIPHIRIALLAHGDYCDYTSDEVLRTSDFTNDVTALVNFAQSAPKTSGGDSPECYEWVLREAGQLDWGEDSAKALVVIGDDVPHPPSMTDQNVHWRHEIQMLKAQGVKIYGVKAQHNDYATPFYEMISEFTGGAYIQFNNFQVITDMFLAVCYKCAGEEQFNEFKEEVERRAVDQPEGANQVASDVMQVLQQIDEAEKKQAERVQDDSEEIPDRWKVNKAWWDPERLDVKNKTPSYCYDAQTRKWNLYTHVHSTSEYKPGAYVPPPATKREKSKTPELESRPTSSRNSVRGKVKCSVM